MHVTELKEIFANAKRKYIQARKSNFTAIEADLVALDIFTSLEEACSEYIEECGFEEE